jgi:heat shock protein HtpX
MIEGARPVLVYDRIAANRRDTIILLIAFAMIMAPATLYVNEMLTGYYAFGRVLSGSAGADPDRAELERVIRQGRVLGAAFMLGVLCLAAWLQYRKADVLALRLVRATRLPAGAEVELRRAAEGLAIAAGLPEPTLYRIESSSANAFSVGLDPEHASIAVSNGALRLLDRAELESVLAYEMAQIGNYDTHLNSVLGAIVWTLMLPLRLTIAFFKRLYAIHPLVGIGCAIWLLSPLVIALPFGFALVLEMAREDLRAALGFGLLLLLPIYSYVITPLAAVLIRSSVASERILKADSEGVLLAGNPAALARALEKMNAAGPGVSTSPALTHSMFLDPRGEASSAIGEFLRAHPRIQERVRILAGMDTSITTEMLERAAHEGERFHHEQVYGSGVMARDAR